MEKQEYKNTENKIIQEEMEREKMFDKIDKNLREIIFSQGIQAGQSSEREDEIKFLESLELDDMDELTMQIDGKEVYLDVYLRERIAKLKKETS